MIMVLKQRLNVNGERPSPGSTPLLTGMSEVSQSSVAMQMWSCCLFLRQDFHFKVVGGEILR